jgi:hypothetical protein
MQNTLHSFLATGLQSVMFDVSDVAGIERKLSVITANSQASKSSFLYHTTLKEDNFFHCGLNAVRILFLFFA